MDLWLADFKANKVDIGKRADKSYQEYCSTVRKHLKPRMGELTCREAENAGLCDEVLKDIRTASAQVAGRGTTGTAGMLRARTVLGHVCAFAVRHGAMTVNPVKSVEAIDRDETEIRALEPEERVAFLVAFRAAVDAEIHKPGNRLGPRAKAWTDLCDLVEAMLATGLRPGEVLALTGDSVDLGASKVIVDHHLTRKPKVGMIRTPGRKGQRKGDRAGIEPPIPSWALSMFRRRKLAAGGDRPLFPTWNGQWVDPGNMAKRIREICDGIGYGWVSSRMFRHTTGTHIVDTGLTSEDAADALGNTPSIVEKHYRRKRKSNPKVAAAVETMLDGGTG
jgi:integrase